MEDGHLGLGVMHRLVVHHVVLARLLVRLGRGEALLLDPGGRKLTLVVMCFQKSKLKLHLVT